MEKKQYNKPSIHVRWIETEQILAASGENSVTSISSNLDGLDYGGETTGSDAADAKRNVFNWLDDEE